MSAIRRCPWCGRTLIVGATSRDLVLDVKEGPCVAFSWHKVCAGLDPVYEMLTQAMSLPEHLSEEPMFAAYGALHLQTIVRHGPEALQGAFDIVRDWPDPTITMRGPGSKWGVKSIA